VRLHTIFFFATFVSVGIAWNKIFNHKGHEVTRRKSSDGFLREP
jgi:hypothetical protein